MTTRHIRRTVRRSGGGLNVVADVNAVISTNERETEMAENDVRDEGLTDEELAQESGEELPDREAMSLINANLAAPVNAAVALNVLSDGSTAYANAEQTATIDQSI
ncbi:MAG TPA: hypothetical protein VGX28_01970 [Frankiaceae bacterium]|nr:hypothetical protein [Frankiaceae bacterium]